MVDSRPKFDSIDTERDEAPVSAPDIQWYDEWCDHVKRANEGEEVDPNKSTVPAKATEQATDVTSDMETPVAASNPALVRSSIHDELANAAGPQEEIQKLLRAIYDKEEFSGINRLVTMFDQCNISVVVFIEGIAKYISLRKKKELKLLTNCEIIALCSLVLRRLAYACLFELGGEGMGHEREEFAIYSKLCLEPHRNSKTDSYVYDEDIINTLQLICLFSKSLLNGEDVDEYYKHIVLTGLLPES